MLIEFYATENLNDPSLSMKLAEWQHFYNWFRVHGSLGTTPIETLCQLFDKKPYWEDVERLFDPSKEYYHAQSYLENMAIQKMKRCP